MAGKNRIKSPPEEETQGFTRPPEGKGETNGHISVLPEELSPDSPMVFEDADLVEVDVTIGKDKYVLRECDEGGAVKYKNEQLRSAQITTDDQGKVKVVSMDGTANLQPLLVSLCLFKVDPDEPDSLIPVSLREVHAMKPSIVSKLFDRAKLICNLDEDNETPEIIQRRIEFLQRKLEALKSGSTRSKNSPSATTGSSV